MKAPVSEGPVKRSMVFWVQIHGDSIDFHKSEESVGTEEPTQGCLGFAYPENG
jgi:hypothetical protein